MAVARAVVTVLGEAVLFERGVVEGVQRAPVLVPHPRPQAPGRTENGV